MSAQQIFAQVNRSCHQNAARFADFAKNTGPLFFQAFVESMRGAWGELLQISDSVTHEHMLTAMVAVLSVVIIWLVLSQLVALAVRRTLTNRVQTRVQQYKVVQPTTAADPAADPTAADTAAADLLDRRLALAKHAADASHENVRLKNANKALRKEIKALKAARAEPEMCAAAVTLGRQLVKAVELLDEIRDVCNNEHLRAAAKISTLKNKLLAAEESDDE